MQYRKKRITLSAIRDRWIVGLIILACIIIPVADFLGFLNDLPFVSGKIVNFTLILLAILTGYVAFTQPEQQETFHENITEGISKIYDSLSGSSTVALRAHPFKNISEAIDYARKQIPYAKQQVIVIYPEISEDFYRAVPTAAFYKQIFITTTDRLGEYQRTLPNGLPLMPRNYSFACFRMAKEMLQACVIIDEKELVLLNEVMPLSTKNIQFIKV